MGLAPDHLHQGQGEEGRGRMCPPHHVQVMLEDGRTAIAEQAALVQVQILN